MIQNPALNLPPKRYFKRVVEKDPIINQNVNTSKLIAFILFHIPLAFVLQLNTASVTAHALISIGLGLAFLIHDLQPTRVIYIAAYITGSEVIWRVLQARIFWETGKIAVSLLLILAILKYCRGLNLSKWPVVYFVLLLPAILVMPDFNREAISFNLAGPFTLAVATIFFSTVVIDLEHFKRILVYIIAPIVSLGILFVGKIVTTEDIVFGTGSNFQTSADYGPNQVSLILSLGAFSAICYFLIEKSTFHRILILFAGLWFLAQSALTFSRSGIWTIGAALVVTSFYLFRDKRGRVGIIIASTILLFLGYFVVFPFIDNLAQNKLGVRFNDFSTTGRIEIIQSDLLVFREFPVFGVGPNQSKPYHAQTFRYASAHTEYSRLLAEHGSLGLLALIIFSVATLRRFLSNAPPASKAFILGITMWGLVYMLSAATRLVAPSFLYGLAAANFSLIEFNAE